MKRILLLFASLMYFMSILAQGFNYEEKVKLNYGLYKVKSGDLYGIINNQGNVVLSIEYQDLKFKNGKALLIKDDVLIGTVDMNGEVTEFHEKYHPHPIYRYIYNGYILIRDTKKKDKYGYINEDGIPFRLKYKEKGVTAKNRKSPSLFDVITPFSEDCATVFTAKSGWKHIGKNGYERFILDDDRAYFRSSVYHGECIIVTSDGIKLSQESGPNRAVVKKHLSNSANFIGANPLNNEVQFQEGNIVLDSLMRAVKFYNNTDSIIFIHKPRPKVVKKVIVPVDTLTIEDDLAIELKTKVIRTGSDGKATVRFEIKNRANQPLINVTVLLDSQGVKREWNGSLDINSNVNLSFKIPARFSQSSIRKTITATIMYKEEKVEKSFSVLLKRYTPIRSR